MNLRIPLWNISYACFADEDPSSQLTERTNGYRQPNSFAGVISQFTTGIAGGNHAK
jgi:hypothetical protein